MNAVYFAHGKESGPWGIKIKQLATIARQKNFHVESPDYSREKDPDKRVKILLGLNTGEFEKIVLVGSSMGAYVSLIASEKLTPAGLFLLAPAVYLDGYENQNPFPFAANAVVIHGWNDDVVPVNKSISFAKEHKIQLHILDSDHSLISALPIIKKIFTSFLDQL